MLEYLKNETNDFLRALKSFTSVYNILEVTKFVNGFFGFDVWRKKRMSNNTLEYVTAGNDKYVRVSSKYNLVTIFFIQNR